MGRPRNPNYREDANPPGSGMAAIGNKRRDSETKKTTVSYFHRLSNDPQSILISFIGILILGTLARLYHLSFSNEVIQHAIQAEMDPILLKSETIDVRKSLLDQSYFHDYYVSNSTYKEEIDESKGVDAPYLAKNAELAMAAVGTQTESYMHGVYGLKSNGQPIWEPTPLKRVPQTKEDLQASWEGYAFNSHLADSLPLDRPMPDHRSSVCRARQYDRTTLPSASVGIVFHNENLAVLLRSVVSVLNRTPPHLLREVILVDDASILETHPWLGSQLQEVIATYPKVRLRRMEERQGLMMARMRSAEWMRGDVSIFLDSHIEATKEWIEPLLDTIQQSPKTIVVPKIVGLHGETLALEGGGIGAITFSWSLGQEHLPDKSESSNYPSPAMAGGLFASNRQFLMTDLGGYDSQMKLYGGEEFELGFKAWMCGGRIEVVPCSRIGHIFRKDTHWKGQVYKVPGEDIARNKRRVAHIWMDEYKSIALGVISKLPKDMSILPMEREKAIRQTCNNGGPSNSFQWYLENVATTVWTPNMNDLKNFGAFANIGTNMCLDSLSSTSEMGAYPCHYQGGTQVWLLSEGHLKSAANKFNICGAPQNGKIEGILNMGKCQNKTKWDYELVNLDDLPSYYKNDNGDVMVATHRAEKVLRLKHNGDCLTFSRVPPKAETRPTELSLVLQPCDITDTNQMWAVVPNVSVE